jgi:hypothetical protein
MKVRVKQGFTGFYGGKLRYEGEEFEVLDQQSVGKWMEVLEKADEPEKEPEKADKDDFDYRAEADRLGIPQEIEGKKVHHHTLRKQVETALAQEKGE